MPNVGSLLKVISATALCAACANETHTTECPEPPSYDVRFIELQLEDGQLTARADVQGLDPEADADQIEELLRVAERLPALLEQMPEDCITLPTFETDLPLDAG